MRSWHQLALAIGGCTVNELRERMSYREFVEWCAFASVEPIGEAREDLRNAQLLAALINIHREPGSQAYKVEEFLLDFWGDGQPVADGQLLMQKFLMLAGRDPSLTLP